MNLQELYAERIGGINYGRTGQVFKFTLIEEAKRAFMKSHPEVRIVDMGVGEPEERAADSIARSLYEAALRKENRVYPNNGGSAFKEAAARYLRRLIGVDLDPEKEIVHCTGTKSALSQLPFAFLNPGESIIATVPGYPVLPKVVQWLGGKVISLKLEPAKSYLPDLEELEEAARREKPKFLLLNYPNNPTGALATAGFYRRVIELAHRYSFLIVQDAAYADYVFEGEFVSPLQLDGGRECTIELYSLSKGYNMQGYRIGFVVSNPALLSAYALVKDNLDNGQFLAVQEAAVEALDRSQGFLRDNQAKYRRRLEKTAQILTEAGIPASASAGTFYLYIQVPGKFRGKDFHSAQSFCDYLISEFGIVSVPWEEAGACLRLSMTFEVGTPDFASEDDVFAELRRRLCSQ